MKLHKDRNRPNRHGGTNYGTLCGRTNRQSPDGMNVAESDDRVSCKFCLKLMANERIGA